MPAISLRTTMLGLPGIKISEWIAHILYSSKSRVFLYQKNKNTDRNEFRTAPCLNDVPIRTSQTLFIGAFVPQDGY